MSFTAEQKSQLAKLMATENLTVQHQKISTAKFDPKNRVLYLPIWQDMSGDLYDLLAGHEVGHALHTPAEGWHNAVVDKAKPASYKNFLNVVEDARIEKKVKRRYPGLRLPFQRAYKELFDRDFFGIRNRDPNKLPFIDRLNIYSKSQYTASFLEFSERELDFVDRIQKTESWDDVVALTNEIFEYSKEEQSQIQHTDFDPDNYGEGGFDEDSAFDEVDQDEDGQSQNGTKSKAGDENEGDESEAEGDGDADGSNDKGETGESKGSRLNRFKDSEESDEDQFEPECITDENFRKNEDLLLDAQSKPFIYVNVPKFNAKYSVTPASRVVEQINEYYTKGFSLTEVLSPADVQKLVNDFKNRNERYIGLLAKEFEMRKAAKAFSKSKLSDTGDIDVAKLSSYQFDDNIFRKVMLTPKGKSHGLMLLLDKSGSMADNMPGSIEQILILAMFCRKVNIPFVVYGFGSSYRARKTDFPGEYLKNDDGSGKVFSAHSNDLRFSEVYLREYLNSSMSNMEFMSAVKALLLLKRSFEMKWRSSRPDSEDLSNTPLTEAVFACTHLMQKFRQKHNLDLSSLVVVHDGDSDSIGSFYQQSEPGLSKYTNSFSTIIHNVIVQDRQNKFEYKLKTPDPSKAHFDPMLLCAIEYFKQLSNSKVFGFFLTSGSRGSAKASIMNRYVFDDGENFESLEKKAFRSHNYNEKARVNQQLDLMVKKFKAEKFLISKPKGYNEFYIVAGGDELVTEADEMEIEGKVTSSKLKAAFLKMNKKKAINRVLVSRFIQGIAA